MIHQSRGTMERAGARARVWEREIRRFDVKERGARSEERARCGILILLSACYQSSAARFSSSEPSWDSAPSSSFIFQYCDRDFLKDERA